VDAILTQIGAVGAVALAGLVLGLVLLVVTLRALTNAALTLRTRLFALGSAVTLLGVGGARAPGVEGAYGAWVDTLFDLLTEALARWLDSPIETAAVIAILVVAALFCLWLVLLYYWIRTLMRVAWMAFLGLCLLALSITVILAADGVLPVPDLLRNGFVLTAIVSMLLVLWGVVRMLRRPAKKV
jgi:hypothetical protein